MHALTRPLAMFALSAVMQGSTMGFVFAQNGPPAHPPVPGAAPPSFSGPGWGPEEEQPATAPESTPPTELPVLYVTSVEILRTSAEPEVEIVRVTGLAASGGWSVPQLVPTYPGKPSDGILDLELIATSPEQSQDADGFVPVSAILEVEPDQPFKGVRVRGSENAMAVTQIPGAGHVNLNVNDCSDCIGKKFIPEGGAPQPQQGIVRQEDLPKLLRVIKSNDGIKDIEPDPNRLTLMLGDDNTIVEAFWE